MVIDWEAFFIRFYNVIKCQSKHTSLHVGWKNDLGSPI